MAGLDGWLPKNKKGEPPIPGLGTLIRAILIDMNGGDWRAYQSGEKSFKQAMKSKVKK